MSKSPGSMPLPELSPEDNGWRLRCEPASWPYWQSAGDTLEWRCEAIAGHSLDSAPLAWSGEDGALLSFEVLAQSVGQSVDRYAHPVLSLSADGQRLFNLAPRQVPMSAAANFRDYGGYLTESGQQVAWGKLFRTGHMGDLSDADVEAIARLGIVRVCDFRREEEAAHRPSRLPRGLEPTSIVISPGSSMDLFSATLSESVEEATIDTFMQEINRDLAANHSASYRRMFDELLDAREQASIIHCSAGKDRTGFGGLLVLAALGVPVADCLDDYLLTNRYVDIEREVARWTRDYEGADTSAWTGQADGSGPLRFDRQALAVILGVKASYLQAALEQINADFDGIDAYLRQQIGLSDLELSALRDSYLYPR